MSKLTGQKPSKLLKGMLIYAAVFLAITAAGLFWFWNFINAYEISRPQTVVNDYLKQLQFETVYAGAKPLVDKVDQRLQTQQESRQYLQDYLAEGVTYAKNLKECTEDKTVYMLLCGGKTIGKVVLSAQPKNIYGFTDWKITEESFDFAFLMSKPATVTVDSSYKVYAGDFLLTRDYITEDNQQYTALKECYGDYELPYLVTYEAGSVFGKLDLKVTDASGTVVTVDEKTDVNSYLDNCTDAEKTQVKTLCQGFVDSYVRFTACTGNDDTGNYRRLREHLVPNGALANRMYHALDGLFWVSDRGAYLDGMEILRMTNIGDGRFLCDVTYDVRHSETLKTTSNLKLIMAQTEVGLRVEAMYSY